VGPCGPVKKLVNGLFTGRAAVGWWVGLWLPQLAAYGMERRMGKALAVLSGAMNKEKLTALLGDGVDKGVHLAGCEAFGSVDHKHRVLVDLEFVEGIGGFVLSSAEQLAGMMPELEGQSGVHPQFESLKDHALNAGFFLKACRGCFGQRSADDAVACLLPDLAGAGQHKVVVFNRESREGLDPGRVGGDVTDGSGVCIAEDQLGLAGDAFTVHGLGVLSGGGPSDLRDVMLEFLDDGVAGLGVMADDGVGDLGGHRAASGRSDPLDGLGDSLLQGKCIGGSESGVVVGTGGSVDVWGSLEPVVHRVANGGWLDAGFDGGIKGLTKERVSVKGTGSLRECPDRVVDKTSGLFRVVLRTDLVEKTLGVLDGETELGTDTLPLGKQLSTRGHKGLVGAGIQGGDGGSGGGVQGFLGKLLDDLLAAFREMVTEVLGNAGDFKGRTATDDLQAESLLEQVGELGAVDSPGNHLVVIEWFALQGAGRAVGAGRQIERIGVGMEVTVSSPAGAMLESGDNHACMHHLGATFTAPGEGGLLFQVPDGFGNGQPLALLDYVAGVGIGHRPEN